MDVPEPTMGVEIIDGKLCFTYTCQVCFRKHHYRVKKLRAGSIVSCPCGETTIELTGDSLASLQSLFKRGKVRGTVGITVEPDRRPQ